MEKYVKEIEANLRNLYRKKINKLWDWEATNFEGESMTKKQYFIHEKEVNGDKVEWKVKCRLIKYIRK